MRLSRLQNGLVLRLMRLLFDNERIHHRGHHEGLGGVKTHENSLFLYKSLQGDSLVRSRMVDYLILFSAGGFLIGYSNFLLLPLGAMLFSQPRKIAALHYFTFHAELLPHTEQIVFHKVGVFGSIRRIYVDIKNLEKIESDVIPSNYL